MSVRLVEEEVARFLSASEPKVLCVRGKWGTGKTYTWKKILKEEARNRRVAVKRYAYISLFGLNSLDALKYAAFEQSVPLTTEVAVPDETSVEKSLHSVGEFAGRQWRHGKRMITALRNVSSTSEYASIVSEFGSMRVREQLICFDDIERKSLGLSLRDFLGYVSFLKEERNCKVVLILNEEELVDSDKAELKVLMEKVIDISIEFAPTPRECVDVVLTGQNSWEVWIRDHCSVLAIRNIRTVQKILFLVGQFSSALKEFDESVFRQSVHSIVLFAWSKYEPNSAPTIEFMRSRNRGVGADGKANPSAKETAWSALLEDYQFGRFNELDVVILDFVEKGYFDHSALEAIALKLNDAAQSAASDRAFQEAWRLYHDSFDDNEDEVTAGIFRSFLENYKAISPMNVNGTVRLLKDLGRAEQAAKVIAHYVENRETSRELFDLNAGPFGGEVSDPDVRTAFAAKLSEIQSHKDPDQILLDISRDKGWSEEDIGILSALSVAEFVEIFKARRGQELRRVINGALFFDRVSNATPEMKAASSKARAALATIGASSRINRRRVRAYGIEPSNN